MSFLGSGIEVERGGADGQPLTEAEVIELAAQFDTRIVGSPIEHPPAADGS